MEKVEEKTRKPYTRTKESWALVCYKYPFFVHEDFKKIDPEVINPITYEKKFTTLNELAKYYNFKYSEICNWVHGRIKRRMISMEIKKL